MDQINNHSPLDHSQSPMDEIDFDKIRQVSKTSVLWIILAFALTISGAFVYLRYTKPIYQSESILKLDIKNESGLLGIQNPMQQDIKGLSGEIEILRSRLFLTKVAEEVNLDISYYHPGRSHLVDERFGNSPFVVAVDSIPNQWYDRQIDVEITGDNSFELPSLSGSQSYDFGALVTLEGLSFSLKKTSYFEDQKDLGFFYFVFNSQKSVVDYLLKNIIVEPINFNANTVKVSFTGPDKHKAQQLVNIIDRIYLKYSREVKNQATEQKITFLDNQMAQTVKELGEYEDYFENFTIENKTTDLSSDLANAIQALNELDSQRLNLRTALIDVEVVKKQVESQGLVSYSKVPSTLSKEIVDYNELVEERELKLDNYNENTQVISNISHKLQLAHEALVGQLQDYQTGLIQRRSELEIQRKRLEKALNQLPSMGTSYNKKQRMHSIQEEYYFSLIKSKMELEIAKAGTVTNFVILSPATLPTIPVEPKKFIIYGIGVVAGLIISIVIVALSYLMHDKISNQKDLERRLSVPILGVVPKYKAQKLDLTKLIVDQNPKSPISESLRAIRTNMEFMNAENDVQVMSVTSTVSGEGKTFIGANLGAICAYSNQRVIIIDLDMRKPKVHVAFSADKREKGTSSILIGKHSVDECIEKSSVRNLYFIQAGTTPPNPSELLLSYRFKKMMDQLKKDFDLIILDTPPVGLVTDAITVMRTSDLPIYVVRAEYSKLSYLKSIQRLVDTNRFHHLSVVLNSVSNGSNGYGYGYGGEYYEETESKKKSLIPFLNKS